MNNFTYSKDGLSLTEQFESCRLTAYRDSKGVLTIGWGHVDKDITETSTCSQWQADKWLEQDVQTASSAVDRYVTVEISHEEFDALVDFAFNVGVGAFIGSTLLRLLNAGDIARAADEFERWDHAGGQVVAGLLRRRQAEMELFNKGMGK